LYNWWKGRESQEKLIYLSLCNILAVYSACVCEQHCTCWCMDELFQCVFVMWVFVQCLY